MPTTRRHTIVVAEITAAFLAPFRSVSDVDLGRITQVDDADRIELLVVTTADIFEAWFEDGDRSLLWTTSQLGFGDEDFEALEHSTVDLLLLPPDWPHRQLELQAFDRPGLASMFDLLMNPRRFDSTTGHFVS